jgi:hypothetical protein
MVGIETLKQDITTIAKVIGKVDKALEDDKVSLSEGIGLAFELPGLFKIAKSYKNAWAELRDLSDDEVAELSDHFAQEFDLSDDDAEIMVENFVELLLSLASAFLSLPKSE